MLSLVSGVVFAFYKTNLHDGLMKITPYGKMSLTNYIAQSGVGALIFFPFGLGLASRCGYALSLVIGVAVFVLQAAFCRWWLRGHRQGPLESLWHRMTWLGAK